MKIRAIYTFGSPRTLSPEAADYAEASLLPNRIYRHVRSGDVIPETPFKTVDPGAGERLEIYDHAGLIAWFDAAGQLAFDRGPWRRSKQERRRILSDLEVRAPEAFEAHKMGPYQALVYEQQRRRRRPRANGWDPAVALICARAVRLASHGPPVREVVTALGFQRARLVRTQNVEALVALPRPVDGWSFGVVAFAGSAMEDFLRLARRSRGGNAARLEPWYPGAPGAADAEWLREVLEIETGLGHAARDQADQLPVFVTGHGAGAARATLWGLRSAESERAERQAERVAPRPATKLPWESAAPPGIDWRQPGVYSEVGRRLRHLRTHHGWTQSQLASSVGIDQSDLSHIERGEYRIRLDVLLEILAVFDVSIAEFFDETEPESLAPADVAMLRDFALLSDADQAAVRSLLRFKLSKR